MYCPFCGHEETKVIDSRLAGEGRQIRRRRQCSDCNERFTTFESAELVMPRLVKSDNRREPFDEQKMRGSMRRALEKRPVSSDDFEQALGRLIHKLRTMGEREVPSRLIDDNDGMGVGGDGSGDFPQMKGHGAGVAYWKHQGRADAPGWADGAEDPGRASTLIMGRHRTGPPFRPAPGDLVFLADPGLVLKPNFYGCSSRELGPDLRHLSGELFLKSVAAAGSCA